MTFGNTRRPTDSPASMSEDLANLAAHAASSVAIVRQEARGILANAAGLRERPEEGASSRLAAALEASQNFCGAIDALPSEGSSANPAPRKVNSALEAAWEAWGDLEVIRRLTATKQLDPPDIGPPPPPEQSLLQCAEACVPPGLRARPVAPLELRTRKDGTLAALELCVDGAFRAVVHVERSESHWVPTGVAVGPSHDPMEAGAMQPATLLVYNDLSSRAGSLMVRLGRLPPSKRLRALLRWLCSLHTLFESACSICNEVFPPEAFQASDLLPPTARGTNLAPSHGCCYLTWRGKCAEQAYVDQCVDEEQGGDERL